MKPFAFVGIVMGCFALSGCAGKLMPSHHAPEEYSAIFAAASAGDIAKLRRDIDDDPELIKATEWDGRTLLHDAADKSQASTAQYLLDRGADVNAVTGDGRTALHMAAQRGDISMIKLLLSRDASIDKRDAKRWTPLDRAIKWQRQEAAALLRSHGAHT